MERKFLKQRNRSGNNMNDIKITNGRNNSAILSFFHILVGIWILVLTIPFLFYIYYLIDISYYKLELQILMGFLFHIIIGIFLFSNSYYIYKNNKSKFIQDNYIYYTVIFFKHIYSRHNILFSWCSCQSIRIFFRFRIDFSIVHISSTIY